MQIIIGAYAMKRAVGRHAAYLAILQLCFAPPGLAAGLDLSFTARAEAGLDPATRDFISHLPDEWRPKIEKIVDDTMDRVDLSVETYIGDVKNLVSDSLVQTQCLIVATEKQIVDDLVKRLPWVSKDGSMTTLRNEIRTREAGMSSSATPVTVKDVYGDLMLATGILSCTAGANFFIKDEARRISEDLSRRWLVWNRIETLDCKDPDSCFDAYRKTIDDFISAADKRDVEKSGATAALATIQKPKRGILFGPDFSDVEEAYSELYGVENAVGAAKALRESLAIKEMLDAEEHIPELTRAVDNIMIPAIGYTHVPLMGASECWKFGNFFSQHPFTRPPGLDAYQTKLTEAASEADILSDQVAVDMKALQKQAGRLAWKSYCKK